MSHSRSEQKIMFAFYIVENILEKIETATEKRIEKYFVAIEKENKNKIIDEIISVSEKTIRNLVAATMGKKDTITSMQEGTLENIAILFKCQYRRLNDFYKHLGNTKNGKKYVDKMKQFVTEKEAKLKTNSSQSSYIHPRAKVFLGSWEGKSREPKGKFPISIELTTITLKGRVSGTGKIHYVINNDELNIDTIETLNFDGEILTDSYLRLNYRNDDPKTIHFGTIFFRLLNNGLTLQGEFAGIGLTTGGTVSGQVVVKKVK